MREPLHADGLPPAGLGGGGAPGVAQAPPVLRGDEPRGVPAHRGGVVHDRLHRGLHLEDHPPDGTVALGEVWEPSGGLALGRRF